MSQTTLLRVLSVVVPVVAASACMADGESSCDPATLHDALGLGQYERPVWDGLRTFRSLSSDCGDSADTNYFYWGDLAQLESYVGNHGLALSYFSKGRWSGRSAERVSLPADIRAVPAAAYIARRARDHRVVIVNERHHASTDRLLTMNLLDGLAALGFRYLALEAAARGANPTNERGYPVRQSGYYINDVVFAELVRSAIDRGFEIVGYEIEGDQWQRDKDQGVTETYHARRQYWQGRNIVDRVLRDDPDAKVLVHCGWGHVRESGSSNWPKMAEVLARLAGLDPLTVDQVIYADNGDPSVNHPLRRAAQERGFVGDEEAVLLANDGDAVPIGDPAYVDIHVLGRETRYESGRPTWMAMGGRRQAVTFPTPECELRPCIVEARSARQPDAVPFDRIESKGEATVLYVPPGQGSVGHVFRLDGTLAAKRSIVVATTENHTVRQSHY